MEIRKSNYDKYPATKISGEIQTGWKLILEELKKSCNSNRIIAVDLYPGVHEDEVITAFLELKPEQLLLTRELMKSEKEIRTMTDRFMTDDVLFGYITNLRLEDYFDSVKLNYARQLIENNPNTIIIGIGASLIAPQDALIVYADMARWEIQQRFRRNEVMGIGVDNRRDPVSLQYKRGYFNDWRICDIYKDRLMTRVDYWIDTHIPKLPKMISGKTFINGLETTVKSPFRVVPFFDPAPWGGQWMKEFFELDADKSNYGWCFDCVPEENSLLLNVNGTNFEMPSVNLVLLKTRELLGEPVESRFGKDFPIRFDLLDTMDGGNLSMQVHPTTQFIRENFGMTYTQDESYYLIDAKDNATVYLGLKTGIDKNEMISDLRKAQDSGAFFDADKYVNKIPTRKHDHFLIPGGTIHCSGSNSLVLEISSTPNLFTFKLWDWQRLGLDGKPRPINIERGKEVIEWSRDTDYTTKNLHNKFTEISSGDGWKEERTGLHPNEFIETRRHIFTATTHHFTNNSVNVINLVEGDEVIVKSPTNDFDPFVIHYAETFIVPAQVKEYTITPHGLSLGKECITIKASVRF